jgi:hypothetical protein
MVHEQGGALVMSLYCTHLHEQEGGITIPCTRETPAFYRVVDNKGKEVDGGLCKHCAEALCPAEGKVEVES